MVAFEILISEIILKVSKWNDSAEPYKITNVWSLWFEEMAISCDSIYNFK